MAGNDDIKLDNDDNSEESSLTEQLRWEQEDKARTMIESGDLGNSSKSLKLLSAPGLGGKYDSLLRGIVGDTEGKRKAHLRHSRLADEKAFPEIYPWKKDYANHKRGYKQVTDDSQTYITKKQFINLHSAVSFANYNGVALNAHITISWGQLGYTNHSEAAKALTDGFFKPLDDWYANNNKVELGVRHVRPLYWIYSHECSKKLGFHTHILAGIPLEIRREFKGWARNRIEALAKIKQPPKEVLDIDSPPSDLIGRQWRRFQYLCKGLDPNAKVRIAGYQRCVRLYDLLECPYESPGRIECKKRVGTSGNLSAAARAKAGFKSKSEEKMFDKRLLYTSSLYDNWHHNKVNEAACEAYSKRTNFPFPLVTPDWDARNPRPD